jgi:hypothetical protein
MRASTEMAVINELALKADVARLFPDKNYQVRKQPNLRQFFDTLVNNLVLLETAVVENFVSVGYGGIGIDASVAMPDIGAGFTKITGFDLNLIAVPVRITQDLPNSALAFEESGVWQIYVKVTLTFAELNAGREISLRVSNETAGIPGAVAFEYFVGRNVGGANLAFTLNAEIAEDKINDLFIIEVGGGDSFTGVTNVGTIYQTNHISEFRGEL